MRPAWRRQEVDHKINHTVDLITQSRQSEQTYLSSRNHFVNISAPITGVHTRMGGALLNRYLSLKRFRTKCSKRKGKAYRRPAVPWLPNLKRWTNDRPRRVRQWVLGVNETYPRGLRL